MFYFIFFIPIIFLFKECNREILFILGNISYLLNFFIFKKDKFTYIDAVYIICDKSNKERINNINTIKKSIKPECFLFEGIFPNRLSWIENYEKYSKLYPSLLSKDYKSHGCFLSHIILLKSLLETNYNNVLILEDNIDLVREIPNEIKVPNDFDILSIEENRQGGVFYNFDFIRVTNGCGTCGYLVNVNSIPFILDKLKEVSLPIDLSYIELSFNNIIKMYKSNKNYVKRSKMNTVREIYR